MAPSTGLARRALVWLVSALLAASLAGCGAEAKERKSFIDFLQARIVDKPGVHVPKLTQAEEKSFGEYSKHFAVIRDFHGAMDSKVSVPLRESIRKGMPKSMPDLLARRADMARLRETSVLMRTTIDAELEKANAARAALKHPDDLKPVFDQAYARTVSEPAKAVRDFMPAVEAMLDSAEKLADFLDAHKDEIKFRGSLLEVSNPALLAQANALMAQMNAKGNDISDAQRKMATMISRR